MSNEVRVVFERQVTPSSNEAVFALMRYFCDNRCFDALSMPLHEFDSLMIALLLSKEYQAIVDRVKEGKK